MTQLKLFVLGFPRLERDGQRIALQLRKALALLVYLAFSPQAHSRDYIATLLWPESDASEGRGRLRRLLHRLQDAVGDGILDSQPKTIALLPAAELWLDYAAFNAHAAAGLAASIQEIDEPERLARLTAAVELYREEFLAGFSLPDSPSFDEWQFFQRESLRQRYRQLLEQLVQVHRSHRGWEHAIAYARRSTALDELHEPAQRTLMELYALSGQHAAALRQYQECVRLLASEIGAEPENATTALYDAIRLRHFPPPGHDAVPPGGDEAELRGPRTPLEPPAPGRRQVLVPPTALIGREAEMAAIHKLLRQEGVRVLTLTGPGGVGKTRLALEISAAHQHLFAGGAAFVSLAPLADPALVMPTIARTLGLREAAGQTVAEALSAYLHDKHLLLVLDNFEHVLACAPQIAELLSSCPLLVTLATSRAPLHLRGEQEYAVGPLALPDTKRLPTPEQIGAIAAVQLFVQLARQVNAAFDLTPDNAPIVAAICRRLDGLPLALELAAARIKLLAPATLLARLDRALPLLVGGARDLPKRQQTMRRAIDWSYDLLQPKEQTLLRTLAVFAGGWNLEAAEAIGGDAGDVMDLLGQLVDQSLVLVADEGFELRYRMLEPIRQYALTRLEEQGEIDAIKQLHALLYLSLAEQAQPKLLTNGQVEWMRRLDRELDNLRAAMGWFLERKAAEEATRMSYALWIFWYAGYGREGRHYADATHALPHDLPASKRSLSAIAGLLMAYNNGDDEAVLRYSRLLSEASHQMGRDPAAEAFAQVGFGGVALNRNELDAATVCLEQALPLCIESDQPMLTSLVYTLLGIVQMRKGEIHNVRQFFERGLNLARQIGHVGMTFVALFGFGQLALALGDAGGARASFRESLSWSQQIGEWVNVAHCLDGLAIVAASGGEAERAVRLLGWAEELRDTIGVPVWPFYKMDQNAYQQTVTGLRAQLGDAVFRNTWAEGRRMTWEQIEAMI